MITGENNHLRFTESPGNSLCSAQTLAEGCEVPPSVKYTRFSFLFAKVMRMFGFRFEILSISDFHLMGRLLQTLRHFHERGAG